MCNLGKDCLPCIKPKPEPPKYYQPPPQFVPIFKPSFAQGYPNYPNYPQRPSENQFCNQRFWINGDWFTLLINYNLYNIKSFFY